jgi:hypothetical protein
MQMIIEFYVVNIFVKETFITSVGPGRAELNKDWAGPGHKKWPDSEAW